MTTLKILAVGGKQEITADDGETLTLPKFGLPQVRGQKSAQVYYEQSIANASTSTVPEKHSL